MLRFDNPHTGERTGQRAGFTLAELLVVISIIALLVAILMPTFRGAVEATRDAGCKNNLYHIAQTLHSNTQNNAYISSGYNWLGTALAYSDGSRDMVWCPADTRDRSIHSFDSLMRMLQDYYILQYHSNSDTVHDVSPFRDIFAGKAVPDPQVWAWYPPIGRRDNPKGEEWPNGTLPTLQNNQAFIGVDNDAAVLITFGNDRITFENWKPPDSSLAGYSRQYVNKGAGTPPTPLAGNQKPEDADDKMVIALYGWDNKRYGDKVFVTMGAQSSYGINSLVTDENWRPNQYLVMDANELVIDLKGVNRADFLDQTVNPRHRGKVNVASCDGGVSKTTLLQMEKELAKPQGLWVGR